MGNWRPPEEEELLFYQGYGKAQIDPRALAYYRYERIIQDIAAYCEQLLLTAGGGEDRVQALRYLKSNFLPNNTIEIAYNSDKTLRTRRLQKVTSRMTSRRQFIHGTIFLLGGLVLASCGALPREEDEQSGSKEQGDPSHWFMPDEGEPHKRTWMAFGASEDIWGESCSQRCAAIWRR